ncbi:ROK family protein [Georgenia satyanarayanai]|uniref:ROK family protein n=1 Tax=Georgenia satyanarayanai TaxID=860221 RepID=UPI002041B260|nr:ROK family protein [Georgenia satyanarayanai]MCM3660273.1 ROK family protein [Georgenia satyanarayanai]
MTQDAGGAQAPAGVIGLDIGGTKVRGLLRDADGVPVSTARVLTRQGPQGVVASALECIDMLLSDAGAARHDVRAIGIGVPGVVDVAAGTVTSAVNLGIGPEPFALARALTEQVGCLRVRLENDVNVAALGAARTLGIDDAAYLALGTGVAAGIVLSGRLLRGHLGVAGEIGHVPLDATGPRCSCGQRGCLEMSASGAALSAAWAAQRDPGTGEVDVFTAAARGDQGAGRVCREYAQAVATCVQLLVLACGVRTVVIGGGVADIGRPLQDAVADALAARATHSPFLAGLHLPDRVVLCGGSDDVAALGAALLATEAAADDQPLELAV